jgi:FtsZ-binding cell division protein ZapB
MSETTQPLRPQEEINVDYGQTCANIGDKQHRIEILSKEIEGLKLKLHDLDAETIALAKQKAEIAAHNQKIDDEKAVKKDKFKVVDGDLVPEEVKA